MPRVCGLWSTPVTELEIVICSPSRIQAAPRPATIRVWNGLQLILSSRAGMVERSGTDASVVITVPLGGSPARRMDRRFTSIDARATATMDRARALQHQPIGVKSSPGRGGRAGGSEVLVVLVVLDRLDHDLLELEVDLGHVLGDPDRRERRGQPDQA